MSTLLHALRRERVEVSPEQTRLVLLAVRRLILGEIDEVRVCRSDQRIRIEQNRSDRAQSI